ncbi:MAG: hypothetical protein ACRDMV_04080 [Streptosporangiales bacterium]
MTLDGYRPPTPGLYLQHAQDFMALYFYAPVALVREFLPHMLEQGDGAIGSVQ